MTIRSRFYHGGRAAGHYSFVLFLLLVCGGCATVDSQLAGEMVSIPGGTFRMGDLIVLGSDQSNYLFPFSLYAGYGCYFSLKHSFCHQNRWYKRLAG